MGEWCCFCFRATDLRLIPVLGALLRDEVVEALIERLRRGHSWAKLWTEVWERERLYARPENEEQRKPGLGLVTGDWGLGPLGTFSSRQRLLSLKSRSSNP